VGGFIVNVLPDIFLGTAGNNQYIISEAMLKRPANVYRSTQSAKGFFFFLIDLSEGEVQRVL